MPRYVALLRGVSPMNAKMTDLKACFEGAGFTNVKTVLSSGNVVFDSRSATEASLERRCEAAMQESLGRSFYTIVRAASELAALIDEDPFTRHELATGAKRVVTFVRAPIDRKPKLPIELDGAKILSMRDREIFTAYVPGDEGPVFMKLIEQTFGKDVTTRTWDTVRKCSVA